MHEKLDKISTFLIADPLHNSTNQKTHIMISFWWTWLIAPDISFNLMATKIQNIISKTERLPKATPTNHL